MEQKNNLSPQNIVMGFQHMFVMFGATVLVPILTGLDISVALFASGIGTLFFHIVTKFKVPVYLGSSFSFIPAIIAIATAEGGSLSKACGGIVIAGLLYVVVAIIFYYVGFENLHKILPPHVTGPMIILIGLILAPVAIQNANGTNAQAVVEKIGSTGCWVIALITFAAGIFVKIYLERWGFKFISTLPVIIALIVGYIVSMIASIVDFAPIGAKGWLGLPPFSLPAFDATAISIAVPIAIVTMVEHFGDILAIGNVVEKDFIKDPGIHRTLIGDGVATSISAFIGGPANTTYSENTGAVALTGNFNPIIMEIAAVFAIILSIVPKFGAVISTIPAPVIGGISILLFGMISSVGIKTMVDNRVNLHEPKVLIISAAMLVLGLGGAEFAWGWFRLSGLGLAAIVGIILNAILSIGESKS
jgi:uracil permease